MAAAGTFDDMGRLGRREVRRAGKQRPAGVEGDALALCPGGGMAVAVVAHRPQPARQDVAQVSGDEFAAFDRLGARSVAVGAVFPAEGDMGVGD